MATLKKSKNGSQDQLSLNAGQKYWRMLQGGHSAILSTFIKLPFVIKMSVLSIFGWLFYTDFTVIIYLFVDYRKREIVLCLEIATTTVGLRDSNQRATTCDFQQRGILTWIDSDEPVQPPCL